MPPSADLAMHFWWRAAQEVAQGRTCRFGFITSNSIRQVFCRRVVAVALEAANTAAPAWPRTDAIGQITMISRALRARPAAAADLRKQFSNPPQTATVQHILASLAKAGQARALPDGRYVM